MATVTLFGPLDAIPLRVVEYLVLLLALVNLGTRAIAHRQYVRQAAEGPDAMARSRLHTASNVLLVVGSMYYMTRAPHGGMVLSVLVVTAVVADLFEFESRLVEARRDIPIERRGREGGAGPLVVSYAAYDSVFYLVKPLWEAVV
jgi:hypothetical protein